MKQAYLELLLLLINRSLDALSWFPCRALSCKICTVLADAKRVEECTRGDYWWHSYSCPPSSSPICPEFFPPPSKITTTGINPAGSSVWLQRSPFCSSAEPLRTPRWWMRSECPGRWLSPPGAGGGGMPTTPGRLREGARGRPQPGQQPRIFLFFPTGYEIRLRGEGSGGCSGHAGSHATAAACLASGEIVTGQGLFSPGTASSEFLEVGCSRSSAEQLAKAHRVALRLFPGSGVQPGTVLYSIPSRRKMPAAIIQPICPKRKALVKPRPWFSSNKLTDKSRTKYLPKLLLDR